MQPDLPGPLSDAPAAEVKDQAAAKKSKLGLADKIKSGSDAATALLKAALLALAIVLVVGVSGVVVWRDLHRRVLVVDVSPEAEKALKALGADIDLRSALLDALNERVAGVQQIIAVQGLSVAGGRGDANAVSFKPFGLELSTSDVTQVVDLVFDRPARPTVRLELRCVPLACTDPAARQAALVMHLSGPSGERTASYKVVLGERGMGRSLHQSVQHIADLVLEQTEPQIGSVLFLNRPATQAIGLDQARSDWVRAEGAAVAGRVPGDEGCIADLVTGASLFKRGELGAGIEAERRAAKTANITCKVHADTNIIFNLTTVALCSPSASVRKYFDEQIAQAQLRLDAMVERRGTVDDQVYFRVPVAKLTPKIMRVLEKAGSEDRPVVCSGGQTMQSMPGDTTAEKLGALLAEAKTMLPPEAHTLMQHEILDTFWAAMQSGVPRDDLTGRLSLGRSLMDAIRDNQVNDPHPRELFVLQGRLAMDMAQAAFAALERSPAEQSRLAQSLPSNEVTAQSTPDRILADAVGRYLNEAAVAFENASGTTRLASLVEPVSDVEVLRLLGDALYARDAAGLARTAYAQAVDRFFDAWEPVEQVPPVTETLAHWAVVLIDIMSDARACGSETIPDPAWTERWHQLGDRPPDLCRLAKHDYDTEKPPLLPNIKKMFGHTVKCYEEPVADTTDHPNATWKRRFEMLNCYDLSGAKEQSMWLQLSAEAIEAEIAHALGDRITKGSSDQ